MTTVNANDNATMNAANDEDEPLTAPGTSPYPVDLRVAGEPAVVVGGGRVATRKVTHLLNAGAKVTVISPELDEALAERAKNGEIAWQAKDYETGDLADARVVIACTDDRDVNHQVVADAKPGQLVNNTADPQESDFFNVAVIEEGKLIVTVSSKGVDPALVRRVKQRLASVLPDLLAGESNEE